MQKKYGFPERLQNSIFHAFVIKLILIKLTFKNIVENDIHNQLLEQILTVFEVYFRDIIVTIKTGWS